MKSLIEKKINHLKKYFKFSENELIEIRKMYSGDFFDSQDSGYKKLIRISQDLCLEFNSLKALNGKNPSLIKKFKTLFRKRKIIKLLFPIHGFMADVGEDIDLIIGLVDFKGIGFINKSVHFSHYSLVTCDKYTILAAKIQIGNNQIETENSLIKLGKVFISRDTWICAGSNVENNVFVAPFSVIGAGAIVKNDTEISSLNVGRPSKKVLTITRDYKSKEKLKYCYSKDEKELLNEHLHKLGFKGRNKEYFKLLNGEDFNNINIRLGRIYLLTHQLCSEYNYQQTTRERKKEILDILFPLHGNNLIVGDDLFVDLIGTTIIGDNVTIGSHVLLAGNVVIKDNVTIGNETLLYSTGHELYYKKRRTSFNLKRGIYEMSRSDLIQINEGIKIGDNCTIVPSTIVKEDIPCNSLVTNSKIII